MNLRLSLAQVYTPSQIRKKELRKLFEITACAFEEAAPVCPPSSAELLRSFAEFTREKAEKVIREGGDAEDVRRRLRDGAYGMGREIGKTLRVSSAREFMSAARLLYRFLDIDFRGEKDGSILIQRCFFSRFYSPQVCGLISGLDEGLLSGLWGGGHLEFSQRITAGEGACRAVFRFQEKAK